MGAGQSQLSADEIEQLKTLTSCKKKKKKKQGF